MQVTQTRFGAPITGDRIVYIRPGHKLNGARGKIISQTLLARTSRVRWDDAKIEKEQNGKNHSASYLRHESARTWLDVDPNDFG